ncbi:MAG: DUF5658 family protein [Syntrophobacteraceae bacterium]
MSDPEMNEFPFKDRRSGKDRRARPTSPFTIKSIFGSRSRFRRKEDAQRHYFVDLYSPFFFAVLLVTLLLSAADALLTIRLTASDFRELNPVMDFFLQLGPTPFILAKWVLTALGLTTLLVLKNIYLWRGRIKTAAILVLMPLLYLILVTYEIIMVMSL